MARRFFYNSLLLSFATSDRARTGCCVSTNLCRFGSEANAAVQKIQDSSKGRLPTLEGFVQQADQPTERFDKGYFECTFQVSPITTGGTLVRATAKVTAWYSGPDAAHSGYRVLVSNGRLESDALDRIGEALTRQTAAGTGSKTPPPWFPGSTTSEDTRPSAQGSLILPGAGTNWKRTR